MSMTQGKLNNEYYCKQNKDPMKDMKEKFTLNSTPLSNSHQTGYFVMEVGLNYKNHHYYTQEIEFSLTKDSRFELAPEFY